MFHKFFPNAMGKQVFSALANRSDEETMAQWQGYLLQLLGDGGIHTNAELTEAIEPQVHEGLEDPPISRIDTLDDGLKYTKEPYINEETGDVEEWYILNGSQS